MLTRAKILAQLKSQFKYDGPDTLEGVKAFTDAEGIELVDADGPIDLAKLFASKTVYVAFDGGEDVQVEDITEAETEAAKMDDDEDDEDMAKAVAAEVKKQLAARSKAAGRIRAGEAPAVHAGRKASVDRKRYARKVEQGKALFADADEAEACGAWIRSTALEGKNYAQKATDLEIVQKANISTQQGLGGALVPDEFAATIIDIREQYGVAEQLLNVRPMIRDTELHPRNTGDLTVYTPGEGQAITESNMTFDNVELVARERAVLSTVSNTLMNDSAINIADEITRNIAWSFAKDIDNAVFNGDGTSAYFHTTGFREKLKGLSGTVGNIAGLVEGAGNAYSELTLGNFESVLGRHPDLEGATSDPVWVCNKRFYNEVMVGLANAAGGVTSEEIAGGRRTPLFLGYPVVFARSMPRAEANSQVCCLFGNFDMAGMLGRVNGSMEIATSTDRYFDQNKFAIRGIHRAAVNIHDVGNASATEADREPGPVVGLITAAS